MGVDKLTRTLNLRLRLNIYSMTHDQMTSCGHHLSLIVNEPYHYITRLCHSSKSNTNIRSGNQRMVSLKSQSSRTKCRPGTTKIKTYSNHRGTERVIILVDTNLSIPLSTRHLLQEKWTFKIFISISIEPYFDESHNDVSHILHRSLQNNLLSHREN